MSLSNNAENLVANWLLTNGSPTRPTAWYLALSTADPGEAAGTIAEPSGDNYARTAVTFAVSGNVASNNGTVTFPEASGSWGTITHFAVFDASTSGNMIAYGALSASKAVGASDTARFDDGDLTITFD